MNWLLIAPWLVLAAYCGVVLYITPGRMLPGPFFGGSSKTGAPPSALLLGVSGAITWVFAKSINNAMSLSEAFGLWGGLAYASYWLAFIVVGVAVYFMRTRGGFRSLTQFLTLKYGAVAAKMFLVVISIRLFNEVTLVFGQRAAPATGQRRPCSPSLPSSIPGAADCARRF